MKKLFFALVVSSCLSAMEIDNEADLKIQSCLNSENFINEIVYYQSEGYDYPIHIVHNPKQEMMWGSGWDKPFSLELIMVANVPNDLERYLEDMVMAFWNGAGDHHISFRRQSSLEDFDNLRPVHYAFSISDAIHDEAIKKAFQSTTFVNEVFYYQLDGQFYGVRILYNPEGKTYRASKSFRLDTHPDKREYSVKWSEKYGIFTDKRAPIDLIKHVESLADASYWDFYMNFDIHNGTYVQYSEYYYNYTRTWSLDTWFNFAENFKEGG